MLEGKIEHVLAHSYFPAENGCGLSSKKNSTDISPLYPFTHDLFLTCPTVPLMLGRKKVNGYR